MSSRDAILSAIGKSQPAYNPLPGIQALGLADVNATSLLESYINVATTIGSKVYKIKTIDEVKSIINSQFKFAKRIVSTVKALNDVADTEKFADEPPHQLADIDLAILKADLAVAENGAIWLTEQQMGQRVLPFICQHLAIIIEAKKIIANMHQAYEIIADSNYGFGSFIAGPSKTADIEQSLVLGAHGPRSMTIFITEYP